jgi:pimeloyl-ACP methyl ester carboxylesterase
MNDTGLASSVPLAAEATGPAPRLLALKSLGPHGFHKLAYAEWGEPSNTNLLVCVHGLTRNGRDFDALAQALAGRYRIACPDVAGRGRSDWLPVKTDYGYPVNLADMAALIARLGGETVDWVGTSMGGIFGMMLAAMPNSPIRRMVLNDVGPFIPKAAIERIGSYVGRDPLFADIEAAEAYFRQVAAPFGRLSDAEWRHLTIHSLRAEKGGGFRPHYDPAIGDAFHVPEIKDVDLWAIWDNIRCPVLTIRGAESDLLLRETAEEMTRRGPKARLVEFAHCGHAPALMAPEQITAIRDFLAEAA